VTDAQVAVVTAAKEIVMKAIIFSTALILASALNASADTQTYRDVLRPHGHSRTTVAMNTAFRACGADRDNEYPTAEAAVFRKCMLRRGWKLVSSTRDPVQQNDPSGAAASDSAGISDRNDDDAAAQQAATTEEADVAAIQSGNDQMNAALAASAAANLQ
jgi:hypothetical protein